MTHKKTCIYCELEKPVKDFHREHVLPDGLGSFVGLPTIDDKVCKGCNNAVSSCEGQLLNYGPEGFFRALLGIQGKPSHKKRKKRSPFYERGYKTEPIVVQGRPKDEPYDLLWEPHKGGLRDLRQVVFRKPSTNKYISIACSSRIKTADDLRQILGEEGFTEYEFVGCQAEEKEWPVMEKLVDPFIPKGQRIHWQQQSPGTAPVDVICVATITQDYARAIAKIGFNYFLPQFGHRFSGLEKEFAGIKHFIRFGEDPRSWVKYERNHIVYEFAKGWAPKTFGHIVVCEVGAEEIWARVQLFVGPTSMPGVWGVRIGKNPSRIIRPRESSGHHFRYRRGSRRKGDMVALPSAPRELLPSVKEVRLIKPVTLRIRRVR